MKGPRTLETQQCTWILQYSCLQKQLTCEYKKVMDQSHSCYITHNVKFLVVPYILKLFCTCNVLNQIIGHKGGLFQTWLLNQTLFNLPHLAPYPANQSNVRENMIITGQVALSRLKRSYWAPTFSHLMCRCALIQHLIALKLYTTGFTQSWNYPMKEFMLTKCIEGM